MYERVDTTPITYQLLSSIPTLYERCGFLVREWETAGPTRDRRGGGEAVYVPSEVERRGTDGQESICS